MEAPKLSRRLRTQIDDLPSCLIIDILSRLPLETLAISRFVCKSWFVLFSDPLFFRLHGARSHTRFLSQRSTLKRNLKCYKSVGAMVGKDFKVDMMMLKDSTFTCDNSCRGLLCLRKGQSVYVCNPILGEYITLPIVKMKTIPMLARTARINSRTLYRVKSVLGFSSRSNQFKVLQIHSLRKSPPPEAAIYRIGNGTRQWNSIGIAPPCTFDFPDDDSVNSFLNGSFHWADRKTQQIVYFDFESEQFGWLPSPPFLCNGRWSSFDEVRVGVVDGCLCVYAFGCDCYDDFESWPPPRMEKWVMKEYGVEESWTAIFSIGNKSDLKSADHCDGGATWFPFHGSTITYNPSFISLLQDFAGSENVTVLSRTRTKDQDSLELTSNHIFKLEDAGGE